MTTEAVPAPGDNPGPARHTPEPDLLEEGKTFGQRFLVAVFVVVPFLGLIAAVAADWYYGLSSWHTVVLFVLFYSFTTAGIGAGFHRYFTHGSFKARGPLKIVLAIAGSTGIEGPLIEWVADHRRHHAYSDRLGDPHSPWLFGTGPKAVAKGFWHSHMGWMFKRDQTNPAKFAPDLAKDRGLVFISRTFALWAGLSLALPLLIGWLWIGTWQGALSAFLWASLARVFLLHHVTWSINSVCHMVGKRPFRTRDKATNVWALAILSFGESWHNLHHADPTSARHGVQKGQIDVNARLIWLFEKLGWAYDVRWPSEQRLARITAPAA